MRHQGKGQPVAYGLVCCLLVSALSRCTPPEEVVLPESLLGVWTTTHPDFEGRYIEFKDNETFIVGLGLVRKDSSPIVGIEQELNGDYLIYHIDHLNDWGDVYRFSVTYRWYRPDELSILNRPNIRWTKKAERDDASF